MQVQRSIDKQSVRRSFDRAAAHYDAYAGLQQRIACDLAELCRETASPRAVLDLGTGTGYGIRLLREHFPDATVVGLDIAWRMIHRARAGAGGALFVCADAERLPFAEDAFDLAYSSSFLQWCAEPRPLLNQLARILRPGGVLMFSTYGPKTLYELRESWAGVDRFSHTLNFPDAAAIRSLLEASGFAMETCRHSLEVSWHEGVEAVLDNLRGLGAQNRDALRRRGLTPPACLREMKKRYSRQFAVQGLVPASYEILLFGVRAPRKK